MNDSDDDDLVDPSDIRMKLTLELINQIFDKLSGSDEILERHIVTEIASNNYIIMLSDPRYWLENYDELEDWVEQHDPSLVAIQGMSLNIKDGKLLTEFLLRWG